MMTEIEFWLTSEKIREHTVQYVIALYENEMHHPKESFVYEEAQYLKSYLNPRIPAHVRFIIAINRAAEPEQANRGESWDGNYDPLFNLMSNAINMLRRETL